jgi:hypothetical protein
MSIVNNVDIFQWAPVRDALVAELQAVDGVNLVLDHLPVEMNTRSNGASGNRKRFKDMMTPSGGNGIDAWAVIRTGETNDFFTGREELVRFNISIHGWREVQDFGRSQGEWDAVVDRVKRTLGEAICLGGAVERQGPAQLLTEDHRILAGETVHHVEFTTTTQHRVLVSNFR